MRFTNIRPARNLLLRLALTGGTAGLATQALVTSVHAAAAAEEKNLSDKTAEELGKLRPLVDAKNFDGALALVDGILSKVDKKSYDAAIASQIKAQILLQKGDVKGSIAPMEAAVNSGMFDEKQTLDMVNLLAQLYGAESNYDKALFYMKQYLSKTNKPTADILLFYSSVLYSQGAHDANNIKMDLIKEAIIQAEKGIHLATSPKKEFYSILMASYQLTGETAKMADILELVLKKNPDDKQSWATLVSVYLNLQQDFRAALTIERAQARGFMKAPKENFNLVGIYFNMGQFQMASEILNKGLKDGSIDNEPQNWTFLYSAYLQMKEDAKALEACKEASKRFPKNGQFDYFAGSIYYGMDKMDDAYKTLQVCIAKGGGDKPENAYLLLAYVGYDLKKYEEAMKALDSASKYPNVKKEVDRLRAGVEQAIKEREAASAAKP